MTSMGVPVVPAVAAAAAIIFFAFTAGQPAAMAAIVEHTFIVSTGGALLGPRGALAPPGQ